MTPGGAITPTLSALSVSLPGIVIRMFITTEEKNGRKPFKDFLFTFIMLTDLFSLIDCDIKL